MCKPDQVSVPLIHKVLFRPNNLNGFVHSVNRNCVGSAWLDLLGEEVRAVTVKIYFAQVVQSRNMVVRASTYEHSSSNAAVIPSRGCGGIHIALLERLGRHLFPMKKACSLSTNSAFTCCSAVFLGGILFACLIDNTQTTRRIEARQ